MDVLENPASIEVVGGKVYTPTGPIEATTVVLAGTPTAVLRFADEKGRIVNVARHLIVAYGGGTVIDPAEEARTRAKAEAERQAEDERRGGIVVDLGNGTVVRFSPPADAIEQFGFEHVDMLVAAASKALGDITGSSLPHAIGYISRLASSISHTTRGIDGTGEPVAIVETLVADGTWSQLSTGDMERLRSFAAGIVSRVVVAFEAALAEYAEAHPLPAPPPAPVADETSPAAGMFGAQVPVETVVA